ncbi:MAG: transcription antitermination factor NusB [Verrucomicrobiota bacterium]
MGKRRDGRRLVIQFLYQNDFVATDNLDQTLSEFVELTEPSKKLWEFSEPLIRGVLVKRDELDKRIKKYSANWDFERIASVDKNVLRLALYEMHYKEEVPPIVAMNEAIELAKSLSTDESGRFVNGILDRAKGDLKRSLR